MPQGDIPYGKIQTVEELGRLARPHRKQRHLTLETVSGLGNLSTRFLSEFERGKGDGRGRQGSEGATHLGAGGHHPAAQAACTVRRWITKILRSLTMYLETFNQRIVF